MLFKTTAENEDCNFPTECGLLPFYIENASYHMENIENATLRIPKTPLLVIIARNLRLLLGGTAQLNPKWHSAY